MSVVAYCDEEGVALLSGHPAGAPCFLQRAVHSSLFSRHSALHTQSAWNRLAVRHNIYTCESMASLQALLGTSLLVVSIAAFGLLRVFARVTARYGVLTGSVRRHHQIVQGTARTCLIVSLLTLSGSTFQWRLPGPLLVMGVLYCAYSSISLVLIFSQIHRTERAIADRHDRDHPWRSTPF